MSLMVGEKDGGGVEAVRVDEEGRIATGADAAAEELASTVGTTPPLADAPAVNVALKAGATITTVPGPGQTATATPADDAEGLLVRTVGVVDTGADLLPAGEGTGLSVVAEQGAGAWSVTASNTPDKPVHVLGTDGIEAHELPRRTDVDELEADADATRVAAEALLAETRKRGAPADATPFSSGTSGVTWYQAFSGAGTLRLVVANNLANTDYWVQIFNAINQPANGTDPRLTLPLPKSGAVSWSEAVHFSTGCVIAISSTVAAYTAIVATDLNVEGTYTT